MIEIIALILLSEKISIKARLKGYPNTGIFIIMFILLWIVFESIGTIIGTIININKALPYTIGYTFAFVSAFLSFKIIDFIKPREIKKEYDPNIEIVLPYNVYIWKERIIQLIIILIITVLLCIYLTKVFIIIPILIILFTNYGIYSIIFGNDNITIIYYYGRKRIINNNQIVRLILNQKLIIELNWKISSKHSTKVIKFSSSQFLQNNIPLDNITNLLKSRYTNS